MLDSSLEKAKNSPNSNHVSVTGHRHKLTDLVDSERDVWSWQSNILKCTHNAMIGSWIIKGGAIIGAKLGF